MAFGESILNPQIGMLAVVRNRQGIVSEVRDHDGTSGRLHRHCGGVKFPEEEG